MGTNVDNLVKAFLKAGRLPSSVQLGQSKHPLKIVSDNLVKFAEENKGQAFLSEHAAAQWLKGEGNQKDLVPDYVIIPGAENGEHYFLPWFTQYNRVEHIDKNLRLAFDSSFNPQEFDAVPHIFPDVKNIVPAHVKFADNKIVVTKRGSIDFGDGKPTRNQNPRGDPEEFTVTDNFDDTTVSSEPFFDPEKLPPVAASHEFTRQQIQYMNEQTARSYLTSSESTFGGKSADDYLVNRVRQQFNKQITHLRKNYKGLSDDDISKLYTENLLTAKQLLEKGATFQDYFFGNKVPYILGGAAAAIGIIKIASNVNRDD